MRIGIILFITLGLLSLCCFANDLDLNVNDDDSAIVEDDDINDVDNAEEIDNDGDDLKGQIDSTIEYESPLLSKSIHFAEHFDNEEIFKRVWVKSAAKKDDIAEEISKYEGIWSREYPQRMLLKNDMGLVLKSKAKHAAISAKLNRVFEFKDKALIVQYEVLLQEGQDCGGSYIKLLSAPANGESIDLTSFHDKTPYTIMFGPDKCGNDLKLHFIFRHTNPLNGTITEKHCRKPKERLEEPFKDKQPHLYQLVLKPDNTYVIKVDNRIVNDGSLFNDFTPAVNPPKEIDDPTDNKPDDWDEREKIPDPDAKKPYDWDEEEPPQIPDDNANKPSDWLDDEEKMIGDLSAIKPDDWDTEMDGEWEAPLIENPLCAKVSGCGQWKAPLIENPNYKGKWRAPLIENPNYQGKWAPRRISNPDFYEDLKPFNNLGKIAAVGIELWSMSNEILFDNIVITDDEAYAEDFAAQTYGKKRQHLDRQAETFVNKIITLTNENPWLWGVYVVLIGLPVAFLFYYICSPKKSVPGEYGRRKKTDEYVADVIDQTEDEVANDDRVNTDEVDDNQSRLLKKNQTSLTITKSDLDVPIAREKANDIVQTDYKEADDYQNEHDEEDENEMEEVDGDDGTEVAKIQGHDAKKEAIFDTFADVQNHNNSKNENIPTLNSNKSDLEVPMNSSTTGATATSTVDSIKKRRQRKE